MRISPASADLDVHKEFSGVREVYAWEGGCAYSAERDGVAYVILDERTMREFLDPEDMDLAGELVRVIAFDTAEQRDKYVRRRQLRSQESTIDGRIRAIYSRNEHHIHPFIGDRFLDEDSGRVLRVMCVGINNYVSESDWRRKKPEWFAIGFRTQEHRFDKGVFRETSALAPWLTMPGRIFHGREFAGQSSMFVTNAIKVFLPEADGKRAVQVASRFDDHRDQWGDELDVLIQESVAPHAIAVFGDEFWPEICASFRKDGVLHEHVDKYEHTTGDTLHFANRIRLKNGHVLLLVRLRHPAARTKRGSAEWLVSEPEFQKLARAGEGA